jgi:prepilin-type N-terminal cleavage/methylation domain-containing protein
MRKERGFTLIELLIVLAILGILVGIVAMSVGGLTETAKQRGMRSELDIVQTAIDTYNTQDVLVGPGGTEIAARPVSAVVEAAAVDANDFAKYLRRNTKYFFIWTADGENLTVCDGIATRTVAGDPEVATFTAAETGGATVCLDDSSADITVTPAE